MSGMLPGKPRPAAAIGPQHWPTGGKRWRVSPRRLQAIARTASGRVPPARFREQTLPDDPAVWFAVMPQLFPQESDPGLAEWLRAIAARCLREEPSTVAGFLAWGSAFEELADVPAALRVWQRALERFPDDRLLHDRLAARLEAEELYEGALPVLEWLTVHQPDNGTYRDRLAAARHALKLKADIDKP